MTAGHVTAGQLSARDLLDGWRAAVRTWPGARLHTLAQVSAAERGRDAAPGGAAVPVVRLAFPGGPKRALVIAGTHGNEPTGPRALLRFFASGEAAARRGQWSFDVLPLVNPLGFDRATRGRRGCRDLNRTFGTPPRCPETAAILAFVAAEASRMPPLAGTTVAPRAGGQGTRSTVPRWDLVVSLHEDVEARCLYCYDSGELERHRFAAALYETSAFLDGAEAEGTAICSSDEIDGSPNRGGVLIAAQQAFPALETVLFRDHHARRVVVMEAPGQAGAARRERLHLAALRHYLRLAP